MFKNLHKRHHFYDNINCQRYCQCAAAQEPDGYLFTRRTNNHRKLPNWFGKMKLELVRKELRPEIIEISLDRPGKGR